MFGILPDGYSRDSAASLGRRVSLVPNISSFQHGPTSSNTYAFVWNGARDGRINGEPFDGSVELFRNGDISVTTNGVTEVFPRELPFPHNGFGQDAEWVAANFTNAAEIAAAGGYAAWVDEQVGEGLTNGLYKLIVSVAEDPPETTLISAGDYSIAVTNAGEYVFLLKKCISYPVDIFPMVTNFEFSAVDDIPSGFGPLSMSSGYEGRYDGRWTEDFGGFQMSDYPPVFGMLTQPLRCVWKSSLHVTPATWQPTEDDPSETFTAVLGDIPPELAPSFRWHTSDEEVVSIQSPLAQTTQMTCHFPAFDPQSPQLYVEVEIGDESLSSHFVSFEDGEDYAFFVSAPQTMFVNDDDDNIDGRVDFMRPLSLADDDVVRGEVQILSSYPTNGTVEVESVSGLCGGFGMPEDETGLYDERTDGSPIVEGASWRVDGLLNWEKGLFFNPSDVSPHYEGSSVKVKWTPDVGEPVSFRKRFTVVKPVVEPINNGVTNVVEDGEAHCYTVNPCGVAVGKRGYFTIDLRPVDFPDDEIVWTAEGSGGVSFPEGNAGRKVTVQGVSTGVVDIVVQIGDCQSDPPKFTVHVVNEKVVDVRAWLISNKNGDTAFSESDVRQMVKDASDIYAQVGVRLNLVEPVVVTNIPDAYDAGYNSPTNGHWSFDQIVDIESNTGGLECYFINSFVDEPGTRAGHSSQGMILSAVADCETMAHEVGHAFGMKDVYLTNKDEDNVADYVLTVRGYVSSATLPGDWNGGCDGKDIGGQRYYQTGTSQNKVIRRMVMKGHYRSGESRRDISAGNVKGVYYDDADGKEWFLDLADVGFFTKLRNAQHQ